MLDFMSDRMKNLFIFTLISGLMLIGLSYGHFYGAASILFPSAGIYTGAYYIYRRKVLPGIVSSIIITNIVFRIIFVDETINISILLSVLFLVSNIIEMYFFTYLLDRYKIKLMKSVHWNDLVKYIFTIILAATLGALVGSFSLALFYGYEHISSLFLTWFLGSTSGMIVFSSLLINIHHHDSSITLRRKDIIKSVVYLGSLLVLLILISINPVSSYITFDSLQIFIIALYFLAATAYSYRMIAVNNLILIVFINSTYLPSFDYGGRYFEEIRLSIFIILISSLASVVRILVLEIKHNLELMEISKNNMEQMILSTNKLFDSDNKLPSETTEFGILYLNDMFRIACEIYPSFDRATCYIKDGEYVRFTNAFGFDLDELNELQFLSSDFDWDLSSPLIFYYKESNDILARKENDGEYIKTYGKIKESIRFNLKFGEDIVAGMCFDIVEDNSYHFGSQDIDNFRALQSLMNSYYRIQELTSERHQLKDDIVLSLVRTLEIYDKYTGGHSEEVAELSSLIAKSLGLDSNKIREVYWAGIVHDIGKIGIPENILNKNGRLTEEEFEMVKSHSVFGHSILSKSKGLLELSLIVRHHHEWWNGKGYPDNLKESEIPYLSQILHICDAVDAMARDRIYRNRLSEEQIIEQLQRGRGEQFNPELTDIMIRFIKDNKLSLFLETQNKSLL